MDYTPKLVLDSRIRDISDKVNVDVESSGSQSTYQPYPAINSSNSSITFNVNVPSEDIAVDRRVLIDADFNFTITIGPTTTTNEIPQNAAAFKWGTTDGLGQFPMNASFSQVQATINNITLNTALDDVMAPLLRMCKQEDVSCMNLLTASYLDKNFARLSDVKYTTTFGVLAVTPVGSPTVNATQYNLIASSNPLNSSETLDYNNIIQPRGVIVPKSITVVHTAAGTTNATLRSKGEAGEKWVIGITCHLTEPFLFLSPFSGLVKSKNEAAFLGINNMNIVANISPNLGGIYKTANTWGNCPISISPGLPTGQTLFTNAKLLMNQLTLQPEQWSRINTKNVLPIQSYPRFISSFAGSISNNASQTFIFPIIQLSQIPDTILIFVRPPKNLQSTTGAQFKRQTQFLTISNASISFNNASGILASASPQELYNISKKNGSYQSWQEFVGKMSFGNPNTNTDAAAIKTVPSQGSLLVVKPSYNFNLPPFLSSGSLGAYGLQITLQCTNFLGDTVTNPEMCVVTVENGVMVTQQGQSSLYTGLLTKEMVLDAKQQKPSKGIEGGKMSKYT